MYVSTRYRDSLTRYAYLHQRQPIIGFRRWIKRNIEYKMSRFPQFLSSEQYILRNETHTKTQNDQKDTKSHEKYC